MQLVVGAEHDLDLLDRAPVAGEHVVDAASGRAGRRAGRAPSGGRRPRRSSAWRCWNATWSGPSSWRLASASSRAGAEVDLGRGGEQRLARRPRPPSDGDELLDERRLRRPRRARRSSGSGAPGRGAPTGQRRTIGRVERGRRPARGRRRPGSRRRGVSWASLSSAGRVVASASRRRASAGVAARRARRACRRTTPAARGLVVEGDRVDAVLRDRGERRDVRRRRVAASARPAARGRRVPRRRRRRGRRPAGRRTACRAGCVSTGSACVAREGRAAVGGAASPARRRRSASTNAASRREGEVRRRARGARAGPRRGAADGSATSVTRATPPSRASRGG